MWVGAEVLGNLVGAAKGNSDNKAAKEQIVANNGSLSREHAIELIKKDYDVNYFVRCKQ